MEKLLDKPLEVLIAVIDSNSIKPLEFIGDVLGEFYVEINRSRLSIEKCEGYMVKIEEILKYIGEKSDVSQFRKTYEQLLKEYGLTNLEDKLNSEEEIPREKGKGIYELYDKPYTPLPEESRNIPGVYGWWV